MRMNGTDGEVKFSLKLGALMGASAGLTIIAVVALVIGVVGNTQAELLEENRLVAEKAAQSQNCALEQPVYQIIIDGKQQSLRDEGDVNVYCHLLLGLEPFDGNGDGEIDLTPCTVP